MEVRFHIVPGREKEAVEYLEKSMDEPDRREKKKMNPIQKFLRRPKSAGKVRFEEHPGMVIIFYTLYEEYTFIRLPEEIQRSF